MICQSSGLTFKSGHAPICVYSCRNSLSKYACISSEVENSKPCSLMVRFTIYTVAATFSIATVRTVEISIPSTVMLSFLLSFHI